MPDWNFEALRPKPASTWNQAWVNPGLQGGTENSARFSIPLYMLHGAAHGYHRGGTLSSGLITLYIPPPGTSTIRTRFSGTATRFAPSAVDSRRKTPGGYIWSYLQMYSQSGSIPRAHGLAGDGGYMVGYGAAAVVADTYAKGSRNFDLGAIYNALKKRAMEGTNLPGAAER